MQPTTAPNNKPGTRLRRWARIIHRDLSYFFAGVVIIYAVSGIVLNHKRDFNSDYSIRRSEVQLPGTFPQSQEVDSQTAREMLRAVDPDARYAKHYASGEDRIKIFVAGGSILEVELQSGKAVYEKLTRRPIISSMNRLHYNPNRWWTRFSDVFAVSLLLITLTGLVMVPGRNGLKGRGGIELAAGIAIPILFLLLL
ncbi:MAG TPA: PepSY-associated TM helix domain-containing protein [Candidatus Alistipes intestinigallinarum]|uniref:PepSY-associated TM helix domain-containing protein n=1 Tax=Candidatus Alistipes intestinigallinarum TaxID=2838440 RepID=A0A9D2CC54_9BACT|nr:PepSY-associated TM helix domain-containing protein [Candidatus Alistipes intestinigallinarum]